MYYLPGSQPRAVVTSPLTANWISRLGSRTMRLSSSDHDPMSTALSACLNRLGPLHARLCPRQVLGVRIGMYAGELLDLDLPRSDKRLMAFVETDGCAVDGIVVATGCTIGRRTMRILDFGKVAATFAETVTERAVRVAPKPDARMHARESSGGDS
jgi:formylmethanofuran dehydrogenase subunit E